MKVRFAALICGALVVAWPSRALQAPSPAPRQEAARAPDSLKVFDLPVADPVFQDRLVRGFYPGTVGWRWTARRFAVSLDVPPPLDAPTILDFDFTAPAELMGQVPAVTLTVRVNGGRVGARKYTAEGRYYLSLDIPPELLRKKPALVEFELDRAAKEPGTGRELGLIAVRAALRHPDENAILRETAVELARQGYLRLVKQRELQMPPEKHTELLRLFHDLPIWRDMWFQNVPIEKNPLDLWMMQQIIYEVRPECIVETGTFKGGSALYWAYTLSGMGVENGRVYTVDIQDLNATAAAHALWKKHVTFLKGSSTDPAVVERIARAVAGRKTLVVLDSDHAMSHVSSELKAYAPMVSRGSYLVVEDTHMDGVPTAPAFGPGPAAAVARFLKEGGARDFEQDFAREAFVMTFNPGGWLRRK